MFVEITITGQYATLSRGRISAKHMTQKTWAERGKGVVTIDRPGKWMISQADGFSRKDTCYVDVDDQGNVSGLSRRMEIVEKKPGNV